MKPKDIVVGKFYTHSDFPDTLYFGMQTKRIKPEKYLVIVRSNQTNGGAGQVVSSPKKAAYQFWDKFKPWTGPSVTLQP